MSEHHSLELRSGPTSRLPETVTPSVARGRLRDPAWRRTGFTLVVSRSFANGLGAFSTVNVSWLEFSSESEALEAARVRFIEKDVRRETEPRRSPALKDIIFVRPGGEHVYCEQLRELLGLAPSREL